MIRCISFLLIVIFLSSCGTFGNSRFSKRKHLKGHFWNLKKKYHNSNAKNDSEVYAIQRVDELHTNPVIGIPTETINRKAVESTVNKRAIAEDRDELTTELVEEIEVQSDPVAANPSHSERTNISDEPQPNEVLTKSRFKFFDVIVILVGAIFWSGIIGLIITLFLHIFRTIIPWLFHYSLLAVGIPLAAFVILMIVVLLILSTQDNRPSTWK